MKFVVALCVGMVLAVLGCSYVFLTSPVIPAEHQWLMIALSASAVFITTSGAILAASHAWPAGYKMERYSWSDRDGLIYFDAIRLPVHRKKLKDLGYASFSFGVSLLLGIYAVAIARNYGFTLQPLNLGPTLEPLAMLVLLAALVTSAMHYIPNKLVQPNPA